MGHIVGGSFEVPAGKCLHHVDAQALLGPGGRGAKLNHPVLRMPPSTCIQAVHMMCSWDWGRAKNRGFGNSQQGWRKAGGGCAVPGPQSRVKVGASTKSTYDREGKSGERVRDKLSRRM